MTDKEQETKQIVIDPELFEAMKEGNKQLHSVLTTINTRQEAQEAITGILLGCVFAKGIITPAEFTGAMDEAAVFFRTTDKEAVAVEIERVNAGLMGAIQSVDSAGLSG